MELVSSIITSQPLRSPFHFRHHHTVTAITRRQLIAAAAVATAVSLSHKALAAEESLHQLSHGFLLDTAQTIPSAEDGHFNYSFNGKEGWITGKLAFLLYTEDKWQLIPLSAQLPVDMSGGSSRSSNKVERPRFFDSNTKRICWEKAKQVPGRDPERWRIDALGNIVCKRLHTCSGCLCYEYDHIIPFSKNGESVAENCQILQTRVNRLKSDKNGLDQRLLKSYSCDIKFSDEELDVIEMAVYGSVVRPEKRCVVGSISALHGKYSSRENTTPCNILGKTD